MTATWPLEGYPIVSSSGNCALNVETVRRPPKSLCPYPKATKQSPAVSAMAVLRLVPLRPINEARMDSQKRRDGRTRLLLTTPEKRQERKAGEIHCWYGADSDSVHVMSLAMRRLPPAIWVVFKVLSKGRRCTISSRSQSKMPLSIIDLGCSNNG